ncbi:hypothetical protein [Sphaerisporangium sp. NPDC051011]|uniref:hypothetical protein n=1 Tax=Sphaerisporangium sp. NPDC051011 TaxID=3155792 RepID=UPI003407D594
MILTRLIAPRLARAERERDHLQAKLDAAHESLIDVRKIVSIQKTELGNLSRLLHTQTRRAVSAEHQLAGATDRVRVIIAGAVGLMDSWDRLGNVGSLVYASHELRGLLQQLGVLPAQMDAAPAPVSEQPR